MAGGLRKDLNAGGSTFCGDCPLKLPLKKAQAPPLRPLDVGPLPSRLYVECTAACNISCYKACCAPETGITRTRQAGMLDFDLFRRVIDEAGPSLGRVDFFNYGEAFLHKRAEEMCEYIKTRFPHIYLYTSTNGLALTPDRARRLVHSGIDEVTFSIDGASQATYERYRQRGNFDKAIANLQAMTEEKARAGRDVPFLNWRYILFTWNDGDEEMARARAMAANLGVDRLCWELTDHPEDAYSRRFLPGATDLEAIRREVWDDNGLGNAIPGATPRARIDVRGVVPGLPLVARTGKALTVRTRVRNLSTRRFASRSSSGPPAGPAGGATVRVRRRARSVATTPVPGCPTTWSQEPSWTWPSTSPPRRRRAGISLKFDLVSEGIDWFEACGSPVTRRSLHVR